MMLVLPQPEKQLDARPPHEWFSIMCSKRSPVCVCSDPQGEAAARSSAHAGDAGPARGIPARVLLDPNTEHELKNQIAIILGYCELLLADTPEEDPRHGDLHEIYRAANGVLAMFGQRSSC
jgi:hypothetical protein